MASAGFPPAGFYGRGRPGYGEFVDGQSVGEGGIWASYSADRIASGQSVRKPFEWQRSLWVCTAGHHPGMDSGNPPEATAYRLIPERLFTGQTTTYEAETARQELGQIALEDPMGAYHGMLTKRGRETFVLCGPPARFVADKCAQSSHGEAASASQLTLF
jgi:hypothetical protein